MSDEDEIRKALLEKQASVDVATGQSKFYEPFKEMSEAKKPLLSSIEIEEEDVKVLEDAKAEVEIVNVSEDAEKVNLDGESKNVTLVFPSGEATRSITIQIGATSTGGSEAEKKENDTLIGTTFKQKQNYMFMIWSATSVGLSYLHLHKVDSSDYEFMMIMSASSVVFSFVFWLVLFLVHETAKENPCDRAVVRIFIQVWYSCGLFGLGTEFIAQFFPLAFHFKMAIGLAILLGLGIIGREGYLYWEQVRKFLSWIWSGVAAVGTALYGGATAVITGVYNGVAAILTGITTGLTNIFQWVQNLFGYQNPSPS